MTNKLIEEAVEEFKAGLRNHPLIQYDPDIPVFNDWPMEEGDELELKEEIVIPWLRDKLTTILTKQLTELEVEVRKMKRDQDAPKENDPYFTGCGGCGADYPAICGCREVNQSIEDTLTLIAEQKELLAKDKCVIN